jgi:hypothetical protein
MHGRIPFVELSRCYVRGDGVITQTQGVVKDVDELLRVAKEDQAVPVRGGDEVFHRITCFLYALEYVKVMKFDQDGSAYYLKELTKLRERQPGVKYLIEIDVLIRTEVEDRLRDENSDDWAVTFKDVLKTRRDLWGTAVINVKSHMMSSPVQTSKAADEEHSSPVKGEDSGGKKTKRKAQKEKKILKIQALLAAAKSGQTFQTIPPPPAPFGAPKGGKAGGKGSGKASGKRTIPQAEFDRLKQQKTTNNSGMQICRWYNSSLKCQAQVRTCMCPVRSRTSLPRQPLRAPPGAKPYVAAQPGL